MAGQEGLEPPTCGFGDRRSTVGATALRTAYGEYIISPYVGILLPCFSVQGMFLVPRTILLHLQAPGRVLLVLPSAVVAPLALCAS